MTDDEKRAYITRRIKALVKERDEAVRKNVPLLWDKVAEPLNGVKKVIFAAMNWITFIWK